MSPNAPLIKANLLHLSYNMWRDFEAPPECSSQKERDIHFAPFLRCDHTLWRDCVERMAVAGMNMLLIDVGDGIEYSSRPEIAVEGAWSQAQLRDELAFCRDHGVEPIPKLNFSACHDVWLGPWSRCLSTPEYYAACADLIEETYALFDGPRFFHLGMDEETFRHQEKMLYAVIRQGELWWHDLDFLVGKVEALGARAWVWSDVLWHCDRDLFAANMSRHILQSNWYYGANFPETDPSPAVAAFTWLEEMGYEQIPTGSTWSTMDNYPRLVKHCERVVSDANLLGFMTAPWHSTTPPWREKHLASIDQVGSVH